MTIVHNHLILLILFINCCGGYLTKYVSQSHSAVRQSTFHLATNGYDSSSTLEDIKVDVERYILARNAVVDVEGSNTVESKNYEKFDNPLEMFKPTGWYKDEVTLELATRSDRTIPKITHPLAFAELQRFGFDNLSIPIMSLGGPHEVGIKLGVAWVEPIIEKTIYDEESKVLITTTYFLDTKGSLLLGGAQEEIMESKAAELDLISLKKSIKIKESLESQDNTLPGDLFQRDADGQINYSQTKNPLKKKSNYVLVESKIPKSERFSLSGSQRFYFVLSSFSTAIAHGRATQEILSSGVSFFGVDTTTLSTTVEFANIISNILIIFAITSSSYSYKLAGIKNRNPIVWVVKGILGGPLSAIQLRDLDTLDVKS